MTDADSGSDDDEQITNPTENPSNPSTSGENTTPSSPSNPGGGNTSNPGTSNGNGSSSTAISYTITFNLNNGEGTTPSSISAKSGEEITLPATELTRTGYEFKGWCTTSDGTGTTYEAGSKVKDLTAENGATVTLYAKWVLQGNWSISYELNGGTNDESNPAEYNIESAVMLANPERSFYEFAGWYDNAEFSGDKVEGWNAGAKTGDIKLYAKWVLAANWSISYELNDDETTPAQNAESNPTEYNIESAVTLANPERSFYEFAGWYGNAEFSGEKLTGWNAGAKTGDIKLYAKWRLLATNAASVIKSLSYGEHNLVLNGAITNETISAIKAALKKNRTAKVSLDLSKTTGLTSIADSAFTGCSSLVSVSIPDGVTSIGSTAFLECTSLASVNIPNSVVSIGSQAFDNCWNLTSVNIPNGVESIGGLAFSLCKRLTSVSIPDSVTSIASNWFDSCTNLTELTVSKDNQKYKSHENCIYTRDGKTLIAAAPGLTNVTFFEGVISIGNVAFGTCSLTSVIIPNSVTSIGDSAFRECKNLTSVIIPDGVTSINYGAFSYCENLASVTIPASVTSIGKNVFNGCSSLKTVNYGGTKEQWDALINGVDIALPAGATVECTEE